MGADGAILVAAATPQHNGWQEEAAAEGASPPVRQSGCVGVEAWNEDLTEAERGCQVRSGQSGLPARGARRGAEEDEKTAGRDAYKIKDRDRQEAEVSGRSTGQPAQRTARTVTGDREGAGKTRPPAHRAVTTKFEGGDGVGNKEDEGGPVNGATRSLDGVF
jgi:hypothetical protein